MIVKREIPDTFGMVEVIETPFGVMPGVRRKGEGGASIFAKRLADNFYNKHLRYSKSPVSAEISFVITGLT